MTTQSQRQPATAPMCWCCGRSYPEQELTRLGDHPEVGVCLGCAIYLKRRATARRDEHHPTLVSRLRGGIDTVRNAVIRRGWHERGPLGALLRRIDRFLP